MNKLSKIFQPVVSTPIEAIGKNLEISSRSQKLMIEVGLIRPADNGFFTILPLAYRSIEKCIRIVDHFMKSIGAQKMSIPQLTSIDLWEKSGRYETSKSELFTTTGRQSKKHILGPTYEEAITSMMVDIGYPLPSYRQFPLKLYQIGNKFRDEPRCKFGLLRAKEFLMKDSYSFDIDQSSAMRTYEEYVQAYTDLFHTIRVPTIKVQANVGNIGGSLSHEFQIPCQIGEDALMQCTACNWSANFEMIGDVSTCPQCQSPIERCKSIEVAHTFLLGDKYTKPFQAKFLQSNGKPETLLMGCYGIGISRLVAASIEKLSTEQDIRWPFVLAPYTVCIIPPKRGSKEIASVAHLTDLVYGELTKIQELSDDVVVDDRDGSTIGKRMIDAKRLGYPLIVVIGKDAAGVDGKYELHFTNTGTTKHLSFNDLLCEIRNEVNSHRYR